MKDPTHTRLSTLQSYLNSLREKGMISEEVYNEIRPRNVKVSRAHSLPKVHELFDRIPNFRPIIDTTGSPYYSAGKYIINLLNPLTRNDYSLKDT